MTTPSSDVRSALIDQAIESARLGDASRFETSIRGLSSASWAGAEAAITDRFIARIQAVLGDEPCVGDIVLLSKSLFPLTARTLGATVYDIEFLVRGYAGASLLLEAIPVEASLAMELAILGVIDKIEPLELGSPVWDGIRDK